VYTSLGIEVRTTRHGRKEFALSCAYTGYLYAFEVYTVKENIDGSPKAVIARLMMAAGLTFTVHRQGRILYTDNFYTSLEVMHYLHYLLSSYGWDICAKQEEISNMRCIYM
jgi:Transposase IS4